MSLTPAVAPGRALSLHLEIRFQDGFVALSTLEGGPIRCTIGDGTLAPGLESCLIGLQAGADETLLANGSDLFGEHDPDLIHWLDIRDLPEDLELAPGQLVAFATPGGHETGGLVLEREPLRVRVDLNHPLAGRSLAIRAIVLSVD